MFNFHFLCVTLNARPDGSSLSRRATLHMKRHDGDKKRSQAHSVGLTPPGFTLISNQMMKR